MCFGQYIAGADVQQKSREKSEIKSQYIRRKSEKESDEYAENRSDGVQQQKEYGFFLGILVREHQGDRIHSVSEIMRDHGNGDKYADGRIDLETEPDSDAIHKAVARESER